MISHDQEATLKNRTRCNRKPYVSNSAPCRRPPEHEAVRTSRRRAAVRFRAGSSSSAVLPQSGRRLAGVLDVSPDRLSSLGGKRLGTRSCARERAKTRLCGSGHTGGVTAQSGSRSPKSGRFLTPPEKEVGGLAKFGFDLSSRKKLRIQRADSTDICSKHTVLLSDTHPR
ncbi:hypothetical protein OJAV_G00184310 [Oryzias javanicus]|uniref:Uncharacterized protein n=1 Tax=Oryzias javanicus TaxID=123683 RepID=A0A3S2M661_ORYJA|nr:hypothetical protein OJAV_G00184310 [Oryzias javanicus]